MAKPPKTFEKDNSSYTGDLAKTFSGVGKG
jgi:hypothetical protein